ncbi:hypothetical protein O181_131236 [Austropuccinia psidii MF-1]|uniref:Uncharacterized protein n=1 Tax=Austropuccinia psidii MF-1 TaxID=1389203 RepID=A0A9Q3L498_9BASI|nr:hypothetical protein [Austropuccinia psidii MF-1]
MSSNESQQNQESHIALTPVLITELQKNLSHKDDMIYNLLRRVEEMELQIKEKSPSNNIKNNKASKAQTDHSHSVEKPQPSIGSSNINSTSSKKKKLEKKIAIKKKVFTNKSSSKRKSPYQMVKDDHPAGFEDTKV